MYIYYIYCKLFFNFLIFFSDHSRIEDVWFKKDFFLFSIIFRPSNNVIENFEIIFFLTYLIFESKYTILSIMFVYFFYYRFLIGLFLSNRTRGKNIEIFTQSFSIIFNNSRNSMYLFNYSYLLFLLFRYQISLYPLYLSKINFNLSNLELGRDFF